MGNASSDSMALPRDVRDLLKNGNRFGFDNGLLSLYAQGIQDGMMSELCNYITRLGDKVKRLDLGYNKITSKGAIKLFNTLQTVNSTVQQVSLAYNPVDDECMNSVGEFIRNSKSIERIQLGSKLMTDAGIEVLAPYLDGNMTLKHLSLFGNNKITDRSVELLSKIIDSSHLETVDVRETSIKQKNAIIIALACNSIKNKSETLDFTSRELDDDIITKICDAMKKYGIEKLNVINLNGSKISPNAASTLFTTLKECNSVVSTLYLQNNDLDDEVMKDLGYFVQENRFLEKLVLSRNKITNGGVKTLTEYLAGNNVLQELNLIHNVEITNAAIPNLIEIANKSCVTFIYPQESKISSDKITELEQALKIPIDQRDIQFYSNTKSAAKTS